MSEWGTSADLAQRAGISPQAARKALARAAAGEPWRGHLLEVRVVHGRGGRRGLAYEVSLNSLSGALKEPLADDLSDAIPPELDRLLMKAREPRRPAAADQDEAVNRRLAAIWNILDHPAGSAERAAAIAAAVKPNQSARSLQRWTEAYEAEGLAGLANRRRSNAGQARVVVSRSFDRTFLAAGYSADQLAAIGAEVAPSLKGLWKSRAEATGWRAIQRDAGSMIFEACEARRTPIPEAACCLSRRTVERFAHYRIVNQRKNDRKRYDDNKPRIRRTWGHFAPMDMIVADVKPLDIIVRREDGTPGWPRIIGFFDPATGRLFVYPVLCEKGEGVRQEHVNEAFIAMVIHPEWGFPKKVYTDNGSELKGLEKIKPVLEHINLPGERTIIYARPYNASAKPVESAFARMDRIVTPVFSGYAGRDRMVKKTQTVGRPPEPYHGTFERFAVEFIGLVADMNHTPLTSGERKGRAPMDVLMQHVQAGWRPMTVNPEAIDAAFCERTTLTVRAGAVSYKGVRYTHARLRAVSSRTVEAALPWRRGCEPLFNDGQGWTYLEPDTPFRADSLEGARVSTARQREQDRAVASLGREGHAVDTVSLRLARQARRAALRLPGGGGVLDAGAELIDLAAGKADAGNELLADLSEAERKLRVRERTTALLLRSQSNVA